MKKFFKSLIVLLVAFTLFSGNVYAENDEEVLSTENTVEESSSEYTTVTSVKSSSTTGNELNASMMCANYGHLAREINELEEGGIDSFHIDIMDGRFVPNFAMQSEMK